MSREPDPAVVCAADSHYAMPLAVMMRSVLDHLAEGRSFDAYVIDGGLRRWQKEKVLASLDPGRVRVHWVLPDRRLFRKAPVSPGHISEATYYRILAADLLPPELSRVIYLDSDLVVREDLGRLFETDLAGHPLAAAIDTTVKTISGSFGLHNYRELGLPIGLPYFNAGVLVLDLARWRRDGIADRALTHLAEHRHQLRLWDQDVLNAVLAGDFRELDPRWNAQPRIVTTDAPDRVTATPEAPWIVHFASPSKPWKFECSHPLRALFFESLDRTAWAGWRPRRTLRHTRAGRIATRVQRRLQDRIAKAIRR